MGSIMVVAASGWVNPCGGTKWRTLSDGRVEIEGQGIPVWPEGSPQRRYLVQTFANWKTLFESVANKYQLPVSWLVAIATMETGLWSGNAQKQATIGSFDGSVGIMQPLIVVAQQYGYSSADRADPAKNIDMCSHLIADNARTVNGRAGGFPVVAAMFNGGQSRGGCNPGNDQFNLKGYHGPGGSWKTAIYATDAIRHQNTAVLLRMNASSSKAGLLFGGALALGLGALAGFFTMKH